MDMRLGVARSWGMERSIAFVDLAGFTALTEAHGDENAADLVARFTLMTESSLCDGTELVKSIGDAVMLVAERRSAAMATVTTLVESCRRELYFPDVRVGIDSGHVVERAGDYFGQTVNLAARLAGEARAGEILITGALVAAAEEMGLVAEFVGRLKLRNISEAVITFRIRCVPTGFAKVIDPVCRMALDLTDAAGRLHYDGADFWFCSLDCVQRFATDPPTFSTS